MTVATPGPYSRRKALAKINGSTHEGRLMKATRAALVAHVGGKPSVTQLALIERATWLTLHLALMDDRTARSAADGVEMTAHDSNQYLAWSNALTRTMRDLGLKGPAQRVPTYAEHVAARTAQRAPA